MSTVPPDGRPVTEAVPVSLGQDPPDGHVDGRDQVDEDGLESFPASDAPAHY